MGQNIMVKVIDFDNSMEIPNVQIVNSDLNFSDISNVNGEYNIESEGVYTFSKKGYHSKTVFIAYEKLLIITLEIKPELLNEVLLSTSNLQKSLKTFDGALTIIPLKEISRNNTVNIAPILNTVSGVFMQNGTLNTNRVTIRGIGSRNLFGTSKIRAYYQDIPLTNGSGESTIEDIEMNALGRIEVLKGPSSSIYGAGLGGTIQLIPAKGQFDKISLSSGYLFGSFELQKFTTQFNFGNLTNTVNLNYSNTKSDGYRDNNELDRQVISLTTSHYLNNANKIITIANFIDLKAFIPSSLNEEDYLNNPETASFIWGRSKGFEDYKKAFSEFHGNTNTMQLLSNILVCLLLF